MNPKISIIVPIYNAEKYIDKCIESIINQTFKDIEIILINDGSSDGSRNIIDRYAKKDKRIIAIYQENSGPSVARNKGIKIAKGKYIGFVDSDDYIEETMYEELYNLVNDNNIQVGMCAYNELHFYDNTQRITRTRLHSQKVYNKEEIKKNIISTFAKNENYGFYSLWNKIYLREWVVKLGIYMDENRDHGEDWWFNMCLFSEMESYICIDKPLYNYIHVNEDSLMSKYRENQFELFLDGREKIKSIVPSEFIDYSEFNSRFVYEFSSYIINTFKAVKDKNRKNELVNNVLNNKEVIECSCNNSGLPMYFKLTTFFIKIKMSLVSKLIYKHISLIK